MVKLESLRHELQLIEGGTDVGIAEVWKDKCRKLIEICKSFKDENEKLQHSAVQQRQLSFSQKSNANEDNNYDTSVLSNQSNNDPTRFKLKNIETTIT